jgi:hypothetical protein
MLPRHCRAPRSGKTRQSIILHEKMDARVKAGHDEENECSGH